MAWYCAHAIFYFELKDEPQDSYVIWENVYLVEAPTDDEALSKAGEYARREEAESSDTTTLNDKPCLYKFAGIRKLISVSYVEERRISLMTFPSAVRKLPTPSLRWIRWIRSGGSRRVSSLRCYTANDSPK